MKTFLILMLAALCLSTSGHAKARHKTAKQPLTLAQRQMLIARIKSRAAEMVLLRGQDEAWLAQSQQEFANEKQLALGLQSKMDRINAANAALSKNLGRYEFAWSIIAMLIAALVAFEVFRMVGLALPWGLVAVGVSFAVTFGAVFEVPAFF